MTQDKESGTSNPCGHNDVNCRLLISFVSLSSYFLFHMVDINSRHVAVAFNIPVHNTGIYFDKLYSIKTVLVLVGSVLEYGIFQAAGADTNPDDLNSGMRVRRYLNIIAYFFIFASRLSILIALFISKNKAFHFYVLISVETFFYSPFGQSYLALCAQYVSIVSSFFHLTRFFILGIQFILDLLCFDNPMLMLRVMFFICSLFTGISFFLLYHFYFNIKDDHFKVLTKADAEKNKYPGDKRGESLIGKLINGSKSDTEEDGSESHESPVNTDCVSNLCQACMKRIGKDDLGCLVSPMLMNYLICFIKDFLFPGTLPYALLERDKCHAINMLIPIFCGTGSLFFVLLDNFTDYLRCWSWYLDLIWISFIPLPIIYVYAFLAIHSRVPSAIAIRNSRPKVMAMTLIMMLGYGFLDGIAFIGLGLYAVRGNPKGYTIHAIDLVIEMFFRTIISKASVGYNVTRVSLGYHLPRFRPNHRMSKRNASWYIFRETFRRAWREAKHDLTLNIKDYV